MATSIPTADMLDMGRHERNGPASLGSVIDELDGQVAAGEAGHLRAIPTGFQPLDDLLNGGIRPGELVMMGGPYGTGKTILALQMARNVVLSDPEAHAMYVCYEHDRTHLLMRLLCMESAERGMRDDALTLRKLTQFAFDRPEPGGLTARLRRIPRYAALLDAIAAYQNRLVLVKASGDYSTLDTIREWLREWYPSGPGRLLLVVDYLQKIPVLRSELQPEAEITTYLTQGLKEVAMSLGIGVFAIAASDREGLRSKRMRLADLRGSSALQYEADIGLVLNNKWAIVSREHMVYNPTQAEAMRDRVVMTLEKNRAGRNAVDLEFGLDGAHFRMDPRGDFVRERLVDEKVTLA